MNFFKGCWSDGSWTYVSGLLRKSFGTFKDQKIYSWNLNYQNMKNTKKMCMQAIVNNGEIIQHKNLKQS